MVCEYTQVEPLLLRKCNNLKPCLVKLSSNDITVLSLLFDPGLMQFLIILADFNSFRQLLYCSLRKVLWRSFRVQTRALAARTEGRGSRFCKYSIWIWTSYVPWWVRPLIEVSWKRRGGGAQGFSRMEGGERRVWVKVINCGTSCVKRLIPLLYYGPLQHWKRFMPCIHQRYSSPKSPHGFLGYLAPLLILFTTVFNQGSWFNFMTL